LTDLQTRRAGLSASAELLVQKVFELGLVDKFQSFNTTFYSLGSKGNQNVLMHAVFVSTSLNILVSDGNTVFVAALDVKKTFDRRGMYGAFWQAKRRGMCTGECPDPAFNAPAEGDTVERIQVKCPLIIRPPVRRRQSFAPRSNAPSSNATSGQKPL